MGSKAKLAPTIIQYILMHNPQITDLFDLFGGGAAISAEALKYKRLNVHYNEIDQAICELINKINTDGVTEDFFQWIDRETFHKHKNGNDWFAGLVKTCWSFGNNPEKGYLYGKDIEQQKKEWHEICMKDGHKLAQKNRLRLKKQTNDRIDLQSVERLQSMESVERLQSLESAERLQSLERLERLNITNLSYEQVKITGKNPVLYLDPPYKSTETYQNDINHEELYRWVMTSPYKIYISGYEFFDLKPVLSINHRSTLSSTNNGKKVTENLYCNKPENPITLTLF